MGNRLTSQDLDALSRIAVTGIAAPQRVTTNTNTTGVDMSAIKGDVIFLLNASAPEGAAQTLDVKLQHSDTLGGTYTDVGMYFSQVTTAGGASFQKIKVPTGQLKKFVRAVGTLGGTSPAVTFGVTAFGKKLES